MTADAQFYLASGRGLPCRVSLRRVEYPLAYAPHG
jgi:hypothetical protein